MILPLSIAAVLVALPVGNTPEGGFSPYLTSPPTIGGGPPSPANIEDCVYDRALEYLVNKEPQTDDTDAKAVKIVLDICIGHGLPLLPNESAAVRRAFDHAFEEAIEELVRGGK